MNSLFKTLYCAAAITLFSESSAWPFQSGSKQTNQKKTGSPDDESPMHDLARHRGDGAFTKHSKKPANPDPNRVGAQPLIAGNSQANPNQQQAGELNPANRTNSPFSLPSATIQNGLNGLPASSSYPVPAIVSKQDAEAAKENSESDEEDGAELPQTLLADSLHQMGPISFEYIYTGEMFSNAHGGISTKRATKYRGNLDVTMTLDTEAANWWTGGEVFMYMHHSHGTTLTPEFIGDGQYYSSIDTGPRPQDLTRLGESWYRQTSDDDSTSVKFGLQDANADFAYADLGGDFLNSSFVTIPNIPLPFWPFQTLGISSLYQHNDRLRLGSGIYDQGRNQQQWWVDSADQGLFFLTQADYQPFAECEGALLTVVKFGSWFTSADTNSVDALQTFDGNYGFYTTVDRMLFSERCADDQGLGVFFQFSWAPGDRNQVDRNFAAGLVYRGLLNDRDQDTCGVGYTGLFFSDELGAISGQTSEDVMELFYKARLRPWLSIQPDLQYIARPNGLERDALVAGARFEAVF